MTDQIGCLISDESFMTICKGDIPFLNRGFPGRSVIVATPPSLPVLFETVLLEAGMSAEQDHHRLLLGGDEAQDKDVLVAAVVALQEGLSQGTVLVKGHLLAL